MTIIILYFNLFIILILVVYIYVRICEVNARDNGVCFVWTYFECIIQTRDSAIIYMVIYSRARFYRSNWNLKQTVNLRGYIIAQLFVSVFIISLDILIWAEIV